MIIPKLLGIPVHLWLGILLFVMVAFQIAIAKKILPVPFKYHRINGYLILLVALIHGAIALGLNRGIFKL